ncbi:MAG: glucose-1-phosphate adenylyltransferase subunit GlgD [Clostridia bacterium]|nr:glucose-1-phosphate adenylyltransferase subunit GlgD [Clostridia bacterium]
MKSVAGLIFSNIHDKSITELTSSRTMASIPFACRYRLIDFALSNMVNSGITNVQVITHYNYHSLMDHLGTGKDWDLARRNGGIKLLPPYITAYANSANQLYTTRLEAIKSVAFPIFRLSEDYIVLSDCDVICNIDIKDLVKTHIDSKADVTMITHSVDLTPESASKNVVIKSNWDGRVTDMSVYPTDVTGKHDVALNIWVISRELLVSIIRDATAHGYTSLTRDIFARNLNSMDIRVYRYEGYASQITSFDEYFATSMGLLSHPEKIDQLFRVADRPIYTKVRNSAPTKYTDGSGVCNSLIADGCVIEGTVDNCILFRGVKIGKGTTVKNSILFQDTQVGENAYLNCVVSDKNVVIRDGRVLSGHESMPFYIDKSRMI